MVIQTTGGANAYKDADGFLRIEESEFEQPSSLKDVIVGFDDAKKRALEQARLRVLAEIHEANRRTLAAQEEETSGVVVTRVIDGNPNMSLNDIKL